MFFIGTKLLSTGIGLCPIGIKFFSEHKLSSPKHCPVYSGALSTHYKSCPFCWYNWCDSWPLTRKWWVPSLTISGATWIDFKLDSELEESNTLISPGGIYVLSLTYWYVSVPDVIPLDTTIPRRIQKLIPGRK